MQTLYYTISMCNSHIGLFLLYLNTALEGGAECTDIRSSFEFILMIYLRGFVLFQV